MNVAAAARVLSRDDAPGRLCPVSYRYPPASLDREPEIVADALYVAGGLYGNVEALACLETLVAAEPGAVLAFNGDFHWYDVADADFAAIEAGVSKHPRLRGNVETEIAGEDTGAGCGCAYPADVSDAVVDRSNEILARLRETARGLPGARESLAALPMNLVARVGDARVALVHGDAASLAGWGFAHDALDDPAHRRWIESVARAARADVFACSHTCLPAIRRFEAEAGPFAIANNGATGMPNFRGTRFGIVTRIARSPSPHPALYGTAVAGVRVDAIAVRYDADAFRRRFLAAWPEGSAAHASYFGRLERGTDFTQDRAQPPV